MESQLKSGESAPSNAPSDKSSITIADGGDDRSATADIFLGRGGAGSLFGDDAKSSLLGEGFVNAGDVFTFTKGHAENDSRPSTTCNSTKTPQASSGHTGLHGIFGGEKGKAGTSSFSFAPSGTSKPVERLHRKQPRGGFGNRFNNYRHTFLTIADPVFAFDFEFPSHGASRKLSDFHPERLSVDREKGRWQNNSMLGSSYRSKIYGCHFGSGRTSNAQDIATAAKAAAATARQRKQAQRKRNKPGQYQSGGERQNFSANATFERRVLVGRARQRVVIKAAGQRSDRIRQLYKSGSLANNSTPSNEAFEIRVSWGLAGQEIVLSAKDIGKITENSSNKSHDDMTYILVPPQPQNQSTQGEEQFGQPGHSSKNTREHDTNLASDGTIHCDFLNNAGVFPNCFDADINRDDDRLILDDDDRLALGDDFLLPQSDAAAGQHNNDIVNSGAGKSKSADVTGDRTKAPGNPTKGRDSSRVAMKVDSGQDNSNSSKSSTNCHSHSLRFGVLGVREWKLRHLIWQKLAPKKDFQWFQQHADMTNSAASSCSDHTTENQHAKCPVPAPLFLGVQVVDRAIVVSEKELNEVGLRTGEGMLGWIDVVESDDHVGNNADSGDNPTRATTKRNGNHVLVRNADQFRRLQHSDAESEDSRPHFSAFPRPFPRIKLDNSDSTRDREEPLKKARWDEKQSKWVFEDWRSVGDGARSEQPFVEGNGAADAHYVVHSFAAAFCACLEFFGWCRRTAGPRWDPDVNREASQKKSLPPAFVRDLQSESERNQSTTAAMQEWGEAVVEHLAATHQKTGPNAEAPASFFPAQNIMQPLLDDLSDAGKDELWAADPFHQMHTLFTLHDILTPGPRNGTAHNNECPCPGYTSVAEYILSEMRFCVFATAENTLSSSDVSRVDAPCLTTDCFDWQLVHLASALGCNDLLRTMISSNALWKKITSSKELLCNGSNIFATKTAKTFSPLAAAALNNQKETVTLLLEAGFGTQELINHTDRNGWTALHAASTAGHADVVNLLLAEPSLDAWIETQSHDSDRNDWVRRSMRLKPEAAIDLAANHWGKRHKVVLALKEHMSLLIASEKNYPDVVESMLAREGAEAVDPNEKTKSMEQFFDLNERTPLAAACERGNAEVVDKLLQCPRTDPNLTVVRGSKRELVSPLFLATDGAHDQVVRRLLVHPDIDPELGSGPSAASSGIFGGASSGPAASSGIFGGASSSSVSSGSSTGSIFKDDHGPLFGSSSSAGDVEHIFLGNITEDLFGPPDSSSSSSSTDAPPVVEQEPALSHSESAEQGDSKSETDQAPMTSALVSVSDAKMQTSGVATPAVDTQHETPLHLACRKGYLLIVQSLLATQRVDVNRVCSIGVGYSIFQPKSDSTPFSVASEALNKRRSSRVVGSNPFDSLFRGHKVCDVVVMDSDFENILKWLRASGKLVEPEAMPSASSNNQQGSRETEKSSTSSIGGNNLFGNLLGGSQSAENDGDGRVMWLGLRGDANVTQRHGAIIEMEDMYDDMDIIMNRQPRLPFGEPDPRAEAIMLVTLGALLGDGGGPGERRDAGAGNHAGAPEADNWNNLFHVLGPEPQTSTFSAFGGQKKPKEGEAQPKSTAAKTAMGERSFSSLSGCGIAMTEGAPGTLFNYGQEDDKKTPDVTAEEKSGLTMNANGSDAANAQRTPTGAGSTSGKSLTRSKPSNVTSIPVAPSTTVSSGVRKSPEEEASALNALLQAKLEGVQKRREERAKLRNKSEKLRSFGMSLLSPAAVTYEKAGKTSGEKRKEGRESEKDGNSENRPMSSSSMNANKSTVRTGKVTLSAKEAGRKIKARDENYNGGKPAFKTVGNSFGSATLNALGAGQAAGLRCGKGAGGAVVAGFAHQALSKQRFLRDVTNIKPASPHVQGAPIKPFNFQAQGRGGAEVGGKRVQIGGRIQKSGVFGGTVWKPLASADLGVQKTRRSREDEVLGQMVTSLKQKKAMAEAEARAKLAAARSRMAADSMSKLLNVGKARMN